MWTRREWGRALAGVIVLTGCGHTGRPDAAGGGASAGTVQVRGTVHKAEVGVNCWQFVVDDSTRYELRVDQAPADLLVDQKQATLTLKPRPDLMSTCMVGQGADVERVLP